MAMVRTARKKRARRPGRGPRGGGLVSEGASVTAQKCSRAKEECPRGSRALLFAWLGRTTAPRPECRAPLRTLLHGRRRRSGRGARFTLGLLARRLLRHDRCPLVLGFSQDAPV